MISDHMSGQPDASPSGDDARVYSGSVRDYLELFKPRVMSLVIFTALVGMVVAKGHLHPVIAAVSLGLIAVGAGASGALNMWWDQDIDARMSRTAKRPIPTGQVTGSEALSLGLSLSVASVVFLGLIANWFAAGFLAFTIFFYAVVYSMWLKRWTAQNIVIGGAAGAFPPMVAEAVVTGSVSWDSFILFLIIFMWTPPHFWALALSKSGDYEKAGVPMMPNVAGPDSTRTQILVYTLLLAPLGVVPFFMGLGGWTYAVVSVISGLLMTALAVQVYRRREGAAATKAEQALFGFSILYLFLLFATLLAEHAFGLGSGFDVGPRLVSGII